MSTIGPTASPGDSPCRCPNAWPPVCNTGDLIAELVPTAGVNSGPQQELRLEGLPIRACHHVIYYMVELPCTSHHTNSSQTPPVQATKPPSESLLSCALILRRGNCHRSGASISVDQIMCLLIRRWGIRRHNSLPTSPGAGQSSAASRIRTISASTAPTHLRVGCRNMLAGPALTMPLAG